MKSPSEGKLLRIFIGEADKWQGRPLYEAIVLKAREMGLAGATVTRGMMGFGASSRLHTAKILRLSSDQPVVIEITDTAERVARLLPFIEANLSGGLATIEDVEAAQRDLARIGISAFAVDQLGDIVFVELPEVGASVAQGKSFGSVESVKAVEDLMAPLSGVVEARNEAVLASPEEALPDEEMSSVMAKVGSVSSAGFKRSVAAWLGRS
jgi:PII-like signaling protein